MTEMTMRAPAQPVDWGARAAVAAPLVAVFSIGAGAPLYTADLADVGGGGRFALAAGTSLGALLLLVVGVHALHARQRHVLGRLGTGAFVAALLGTVLAAGGAWEQLFSVPFIADRAPQLLDAGASGSLLVGFLLSYLALAIGWALFAIATLRARVLSRSGAIVLLAGAVFAILPAPTAIRILPLAIGAALLTRPAPPARARA